MVVGVPLVWVASNLLAATLVPSFRVSARFLAVMMGIVTGYHCWLYVAALGRVCMGARMWVLHGLRSLQRTAQCFSGLIALGMQLLFGYHGSCPAIP